MNVNQRLIQMYTELDNQQGRLQMIACEIGYEMADEEARKSLQLLEYLVQHKYQSNLKMIDEIIKNGTKDERQRIRIAK